MDERLAGSIAASWSGGRGLVSRGPRWLLAYRPAQRRDVEHHTGSHPPPGERVWRLEVGGRFLRSAGVIYPGGVPFPDELRHETAIVSSEVWLYVTESDGRVLGVHSWPEAVRKPIAAVVRADFDAGSAVHPADVERRLGYTIALPDHPGWEPAVVFPLDGADTLVFCVRRTLPDPLNEMVLFAEDGLSLRVRRETPAPQLREVLATNQPPFRPIRVGAVDAIGREPGKSLGPQTWPWPGELLWWRDGTAFELKGFHPLSTLVEVATTIA